MGERRIRVLSDGRPGHENQALALAEAIGGRIELCRLGIRAPWSALPARAWPLSPLVLADAAPLAPGADLAIACGRRTVVPLALLKRATGCYAVALQNPRIGLGHFDLVVPPLHDGLAGPNVVATLGALGRAGAAPLAAAAMQWAAAAARFRRPLVGVLVGAGPVPVEALARLRAGIWLAVSRRTPPALRQRLQAVFPGAEAAGNPYLGILALCDHLLVGGDSVGMLSDACMTGKPVQILGPGLKRRHAEFHRALIAAGHARPFTGRLERWQPPPLDETARIAQLIVRYQAI